MRRIGATVHTVHGAGQKSHLVIREMHHEAFDQQKFRIACPAPAKRSGRHRRRPDDGGAGPAGGGAGIQGTERRGELGRDRGLHHHPAVPAEPRRPVRLPHAEQRCQGRNPLRGEVGPCGVSRRYEEGTGQGQDLPRSSFYERHDFLSGTLRLGNATGIPRRITVLDPLLQGEYGRPHEPSSEQDGGRNDPCPELPVTGLFRQVLTAPVSSIPPSPGGA